MEAIVRERYLAVYIDTSKHKGGGLKWGVGGGEFLQAMQTLKYARKSPHLLG